MAWPCLRARGECNVLPQVYALAPAPRAETQFQAYVNLADLYRAEARDAEGGAPARQKRMPQALEKPWRAPPCLPLSMHAMVASMVSRCTRSGKKIVPSRYSSRHILKHARELVQIAPADPQAAQPLRELQAQRP